MAVPRHLLVSLHQVGHKVKKNKPNPTFAVSVPAACFNNATFSVNASSCSCLCQRGTALPSLVLAYISPPPAWPSTPKEWSSFVGPRNNMCAA